MTPTITGDSITYSKLSGSLPTGLSLNVQSGVISGTPTTAVTSLSVTIKASNDVGFVTVTLSFTVMNKISSFSYSQTEYFIPTNTPVSYIPTIDVDSVTFSIESGTLPSGLSLNSTTGIISGSGSQPVSLTLVIIRASNAVSYKLVNLSITIMNPPASFTYEESSYVVAKGSTWSCSPDIDGESITYSLQSGSLPSGLSLNPSTGVISGTPTTFVNQQMITIKAANPVGSVTFSITLSVLTTPSNFSYSMTSIVQATSSSVNVIPSIVGDLITYSVQSGTLPTGLSLDSSSGIISGSVSQSTPSTVVVIKAENAISSVTASLTFRFVTPPTIFSYPQSSYVIPANEVFTATPTVNGDPSTVTIASGILPAGLVLDESTGAISGTPSSTPNSVVILKVENEGGVKTTSISIQVLVKPSDFHYQESSLFIALNEPFSSLPLYAGENLEFTLSSGSLPSGLSLDAASGEIRGTPTSSTSITSLEVTASNAVGSVKTILTLQVLLSPSSLQYSQNVITVVKNDALTLKPIVKGDELSFSVSAGFLPSGLLINDETGEISGSPVVTVSNSIIEITAENEVGSTKTTLTFNVKALSTLTLILIIVAVIVILVALVLFGMFLRKKRSRQLPITKLSVYSCLFDNYDINELNIFCPFYIDIDTYEHFSSLYSLNSSHSQKCYLILEFQ